MYPIDFKMRHYLTISLEHAIRKYVKKSFKDDEVDDLHGWRATSGEKDLMLPSNNSLYRYTNDDELSARNPLREHLIVRQRVQEL